MKTIVYIIVLLSLSIIVLGIGETQSSTNLIREQLAPSNSYSLKEPEAPSGYDSEIINGARFFLIAGDSVNGKNIKLDSVEYVESGSFEFRDLGPSTLTINNGQLESAEIISAKDYNVLFIENPYDEYRIEKILIVLNKTDKLNYNANEENLKFILPENSLMIVRYGHKNITINPETKTKIIIDKTKSMRENITYNEQTYTIKNANLTYSNKYFKEKLIAKTQASASINMLKGFGYINLFPECSYEKIDLKKKENSYSLYNNGIYEFEYGFLKADFLDDYFRNR